MTFPRIAHRLNSLCRMLLVTAVLAATAEAGRSAVLLSITADAAFTNVSMTLSGSFTPPDLAYPYLYSPILIAGFTAADSWSSTASGSTLTESNGVIANVYDTLGYNTPEDNISGAYLSDSTGSDIITGPSYLFSGAGTFDLSAIASQLGGATSGDLLAQIYIGDGDYDTVTLGTWSLAVETPEPGTVALSLFGAGVLALAVRRRLVVA